MKHIYTAVGVASAVFGVVYRSGSDVTLAGSFAAVGFLLVVTYEFWRRDSERKRRQSEQQLLDKIIAKLQQKRLHS
jgi:hypothetical protein